MTAVAPRKAYRSRQPADCLRQPTSGIARLSGTLGSLLLLLLLLLLDAQLRLVQSLLWLFLSLGHAGSLLSSVCQFLTGNGRRAGTRITPEGSGRASVVQIVTAVCPDTPGCPGHFSSFWLARSGNAAVTTALGSDGHLRPTAPCGTWTTTAVFGRPSVSAPCYAWSQRCTELWKPQHQVLSTNSGYCSSSNPTPQRTTSRAYGR